jgi:hypothetical protein
MIGTGEQAMKEEMEKPIFVALNGLNWFLLLSLFEQVLNKDDVFATQQDREASRELFKTIHNQVFNKEDKSFADLVDIKPKKLITKPDLIV